MHRKKLEAAALDIFARMSLRLRARCELAQEFRHSFGAWWHRMSGLIRGAAGDIDRKDVLAAGEQLIARDLRGEELPQDANLVEIPDFSREVVRKAVAALKAQRVYALGPT
jgi:hypothetical protein